MKSNAFTLAEVLITLGVIGVVAALTMPSLITSYQKQVTVNKVKKFYTNFSQSIKLSELDNGEFRDWNVKNSDDLYDNYLAPYLKVIQVQRNVHVWGNFTKGIKLIFADGTQAICSNITNLEGYGNSQFIFPCIFYTRGVEHWDASTSSDTYRYKGPREIFWFLINEDGRLLPPHMDSTREENIDSCKTMSNEKNGFTDCGTLLYKDNWEIRDDYPW